MPAAFSTLFEGHSFSSHFIALSGVSNARMSRREAMLIALITMRHTGLFTTIAMRSIAGRERLHSTNASRASRS